MSEGELHVQSVVSYSNWFSFFFLNLPIIADKMWSCRDNRHYNRGKSICELEERSSSSRPIELHRRRFIWDSPNNSDMRYLSGSQCNAGLVFLLMFFSVVVTTIEDEQTTTLQSKMKAKLRKQRLWPCHKNGLIKTIQTIPHNLYVSFKLTSLYCGLRLILVYPNPQ